MPSRYLRYCWWSRLSLEELALGAPPDAVASPADGPPQGLAVRNHNLLSVVPIKDAGGAVPLAPVRICGVRNGSFSGQIVIDRARGVAGLEASATDLTGPGTIPASRVRLRFAVPDGRLPNGEIGKCEACKIIL